MTITINPKNKKDLNKIKILLKKNDVDFEEEPEYSPEFIEEIREGEEDIKNGRFTTIRNKEELKQFFDSL